MPRPEFVTEEDIERWTPAVDLALPEELRNTSLVREVCYAGMWLGEQLEILDCPEDYNVRIIYTAGKLSFGRDPWEVAQTLLKGYQDQTLIYDPDPETDFNLN